MTAGHCNPASLKTVMFFPLSSVAASKSLLFSPRSLAQSVPCSVTLSKNGRFSPVIDERVLLNRRRPNNGQPPERRMIKNGVETATTTAAIERAHACHLHWIDNSIHYLPKKMRQRRIRQRSKENASPRPSTRGTATFNLRIISSQIEQRKR